MLLEKIYGKLFYYFLYSINPIKKRIVDTPCSIHKIINLQAIEIVKNDNFQDAYTFYNDNIYYLNEGVVWADQDFKSSGHFYNPEKDRGLYGNKSALYHAENYYNEAISLWNEGSINESIFQLGAALHLVQDMTIPQHANIKLFNSHRQYENFIRKNYNNHNEFVATSGGYYLESIKEYILYNSRNSLIIYDKLKNIEDEMLRFYNITRYLLPLAQKTTAGCMVRFYKDIAKARIN